MSRKYIRKAERYCCIAFRYFPLVFVYSITTWAVCVEVYIGFGLSTGTFVAPLSSFLGIVLYTLLNWSYTTAVFTNPGSTIDHNGGYDSLPTEAPPVATSFTVKSNGELRFCKKCQARKPDRAHHCSTCRKCVLKMDHHCPWLATCIGLRNYKAFLLFLIYTTLFCFLCFYVSATWVYSQLLVEENYDQSLMPINYVMLAVISGIIGIVLAAFTGWHISLAARNQTTIECLEKTRYLSPLRRAMQHQNIPASYHRPGYGQQLREIEHAIESSIMPSIPSNEPPTETMSFETLHAARVGQPRQLSYEELERNRARDRYEEYLDEQDSAKLPNAFNHGWQRNLSTLFGPSKLLWFFPICNTPGDGWAWEASPKWVAARDRIRAEREAQQARERAAGWGAPDHSETRRSEVPTQYAGAARHYLDASPLPSPGIRNGNGNGNGNTNGNGNGNGNTNGRGSPLRSPSKADRILGRTADQYFDDESVDSVRLLELQAKRKDPYAFPEEFEDAEDDAEEPVQARNGALNSAAGNAWGAQRMVGTGLLGRAKAAGGLGGNGGGNYRKVEDDDTVD